MKLLGIDYGRKKVGLAIGDSRTGLVEPYKVVRVKSEKDVVGKAVRIAQKEQVEQIVLGISEGEIGKETKEFGKKLEERLEVPVVFQDETLTTYEAQELSIEAGIKRKKRKKLEDAYSATLILQAYIDCLP
jgi:putative Holliday junction resolvase